MWNNLFLPWTTPEDGKIGAASPENGAASAEPPQLFFEHESTLDSCHLFYRYAPDWVVVLARVQHLRRRVVLQARATLPDVCSLALQSICEKAPDCLLVYSGNLTAAVCVIGYFSDDSHLVLSGDSDPAAAAALSLAVDDVALLADSSVEMLDRANSTGVSVDDK